jgi:D-sedoheptulose 7-phosphate isomerase
MKNIIQNEINNHVKVANSIHQLTEEISKCAELCINCLKNGGKILIFGNGGSAADAQHIAAELIGRYQIDRKGLPAIALTTDSSVLTSIGNDFGYSHIFERQIEALANRGDVVIGISTSGKSSNVINALNLAISLECINIGLCGKDASQMDKVCEIIMAVPSDDTPRIQEMHMVIGHTLCYLIEQEFQD